MIRSVQLKLFLGTCAVLVVVITGLTVFFTAQQVQVIEGRLDAKARGYAGALVYPARAALAFDDVAGAREALLPAARDADLLGILIRRQDGSILHEQRGLGRPGAVLTVILPLAPPEGSTGTLEVRVSHAGVDAQRRSLFAASALVGLFALLCSSALSWQVGRSLARRIARLTAHAIAIGEERAITPLGDEGKDELSVLARAFDKMMSHVDDRVRQRSAELLTADQDLLEALGQAAFNEEFNRTIVENAADGILTTDDAGAIKTWNAAAESIFAVAARDAIGRPLTDFLPSGNRRRREQSITREDGSVTQVDVRFIEVHMTDGALRVAFLRDLSEEKHAAMMLSELHMQLVDASRLAGMADVASGILHNVGNVLNSVNVAATLIDDTVRRSNVESIGKLGALLREHKGDLASFFTSDPRGKRVPELVDMLASKLGGERDKLLGEVAGLRKNIEHIREIVSMQQEYTKKSGMEEHIQLLDTINDAVEMSLDSKGGDQIEVVRHLEPLPLVLLDRHLAMQILVNLLRNARHAVRDSQRSDPRITVRASTSDGRVRVVIEDNGVGIEPSAFDHLFRQGYTTKKDGHGYGLHSSANAAKELGGSLIATSDGKGLGAAFVLELPLVARQEAA